MSLFHQSMKPIQSLQLMDVTRGGLRVTRSALSLSCEVCGVQSAAVTDLCIVTIDNGEAQWMDSARLFLFAAMDVFLLRWFQCIVHLLLQ